MSNFSSSIYSALVEERCVYPFLILIYVCVYVSSGQHDSFVMCTTLRAKPTVRGYRSCAQNIPEIQRLVVMPANRLIDSSFRHVVETE